ncbi:MAG: UDP-N-acetylmuramate dehydrogenase [Bacteroidetes bacterium]|jgi:UDP-N-acetylmuramate dehydrogenase|nr:UDP-N-acetylmuramate dehydrogenase [Bacteroidota bacterium]
MISVEQLKKYFRGHIGIGEPLANLTTFRLGGAADFYFEPMDSGDLAVLINILIEHGFPFDIIGNGSNVLVNDYGYRGAAINLERGLCDIGFGGDLLKAGAGTKLASLVDFCINNGLHGMEMLAGFPGTLGGALIKNTGAYGGSISDYLVEVEVIRRGELKIFPREAAVFGYQFSSLSDDIIVSGTFRFPDGDKTEMKRVRRELLLRRSESQPTELPNAGLIFRNPAMNSAGRLIENCGLRGLRIGNAEISPRHGNFIVNLGGASSIDVIRLIKTAREKVQEKFGVTLELEVKLLGFSEGLRDEAETLVSSVA